MPFLARIPYVEGAELGQRVDVTGVIKNTFDNFDWIDVRLQPCPTGAKNDNAAVTVSVRFDARKILTWDRVDGVWTQNRNKNDNFSLVKGGPLKVVFVADRGAYRININNRHFINHPYHNPRPRARFVRVTGPITLKHVTYQRGAQLVLNKRH